jgi:3',5'-cyclic AMP phosphodiesterase CpdA
VVLAVVIAVWPPPFLWALFADEVPSPVAGEPVPPVAGTPEARLAVAGDTGTGEAEQDATAQQMVAQRAGIPYDGLLLLGDLIYEEGDAALAETRIIRPFAPVLGRDGTLLPVLGNHDYESGEQQDILDQLGRQRSWYVERVGPVRVVVLDTKQVDDPEQTDWLEQALARPEPPGSWTVVGMHHPPYSAGMHGSDLEVRETWAPLFADGDVDLVLAGHDHNYQRSEPQDDVTYVVSGAGAKLDPTGSQAFTAVSDSTLHFLDLLFYDDRVVGRAIDHSGELVDAFVIR